MSETETTGMTDSGSADTSGSTAPIEQLKDRAFHEMAKADDVSDYAAERRDREAEARGSDEAETPHRKQERLERFRRALDRARQEGEPSAAEANASDYAPEQTGDRDAEIRQARADAQFELRAHQFMQEAPDFEDMVRGAFSVFPPSQHLKAAILQSPIGPELAYEIAKEPEAISVLNNMPQAEAARLIGVIEGRLVHLRDERKRAEAAQANRRHSNAPPPMRIPSGSMSKPSSSLHDLAKKDDVSEYVAIRNRQRREAR